MDLQKEREAFEAVTNTYHCIYNADLNYYFSGSKFVGDKAEIEVNAGWKAWQAKAQAVPEGFVLMPLEIDDFDHPITKALEKGIVKDLSASVIYKAMIEAQEPAND